MKNKNYPEPDIPVDEAWAAIKEQLQLSSGKIHEMKPEKYFTGRLMLLNGIGLGLLFIATFALLWEKKEATDVLTNYFSQEAPIQITLSTGNNIFLDRHSVISHGGSGGSEEIILRGGGAFFSDYISNDQSPLKIRVGSLTVLPKHAKLFISFDSVLSESSIDVQEGIAVIEVGNSKNVIKTGESISFNEKTKLFNDAGKVRANLYSYATKIFEFNRTPLEEAFEILGKAYDSKIVIKNSLLLNCRITTRFDNKSLTEILDVMAYTLNFDYSLDHANNQILISGDGCE